MPRVARVTDNISHGGYILDGCETVTVNNLKKARVGDPVLCYIHGHQVIVTGCSTVTVENKEAARIGDHISCGAIIITGSENVTACG